MTNEFYSNEEFNKIKQLINKEILRRGTYSWWDPLATPKVGEDKSSPMTIPFIPEDSMEVNDETYTINNPSTGSIEPTRNIKYSAHGDNPGGEVGSDASSAMKLDAKELRNFIVGLSKIEDINLFYGRDEIWGTVFRDPQSIEDVLIRAQESVRNLPLDESNDTIDRVDYNGGLMVEKEDGYNINQVDFQFPMENGKYVMPSGESDGEEVYIHEGLGPDNFFDDYGAPLGCGDYHPMNPKITPEINRTQENEGEYRDTDITSSTPANMTGLYGDNPRNPVAGDSLKSIQVMGGGHSSCRVACTGLCSFTCDSSCSESCTTTCWGRCGEACTSTCGNACTGCSSLCYTSCMTRCESVNGYACLEAGAKAVKITTEGGTNGETAVNKISSETFTCNGCSYTCQYHANKRTECWDSACMGKCFTTCSSYCSTSCLGGCINNDSENDGDYKTGIGRGCSSNCTINCIGGCDGVCEGQCEYTCFHACMTSCQDNCEWKCDSHCGSGCSDMCMNACTGDAYSVTTCDSCGSGCTSDCQHDCNTNCIGKACRSVCGSENTTSCVANCRMNCTGESCTSKCSDACSGACSTCVNTCGMQCGACSSVCSTSCGASCNITCESNCEHSCELNCVTNCSDNCGGCSGLCYSCVGKCIGVCSTRCESVCTNCSNKCSWWCDSSCGRGCYSSCADGCSNSCITSCVAGLTSETKSELDGPEYPPTAEGYQYPNPENRFEEQDSFRIIRDNIDGPTLIIPDPTNIIVVIDEDENIYMKNIDSEHYFIYQTSISGGVFDVDSSTGDISINPEMVDSIIDETLPQYDLNPSLFVFVIPSQYAVDISISTIGFDLQYWYIHKEPIFEMDAGHIVIIIEKRIKIEDSN